MIARWVDAGAPQGNPADMPPPRQFAKTGDWQIGKPDLVIKFPAYPVPPAGPDLFGELFADIPIDEDRYIQAIQTRSATQESHKVVHHALSYSVDRRPDEATSRPWTEGSSSSSTPRARTPRSIRRARACCCRRASARDSAITSTPSAKETRAEVELGIKLYPEGLRAEAHPLVAAARAADDAARHSGRHRRAQRRLHHPPQAGAADRVPAAHAQPRQTAVPRADLSDLGYAHDDRDAELRQLQQQLASHLQLRRRRAAAGSGRDDPAQHPVARQHEGQSARARSEELGG